MVDKYAFSVLCTLHFPLNICYKKHYNEDLAKFEAFVDRVFSILYDLGLYADLVFGKYMTFY